jgi:glycosyltransferase involved in cell wall biosynthesis
VSTPHEQQRPARVLFADHTPIVGGAELVLATHIAALDRSRFHSLVACTDRVPMLIDLYREAGADVHLLPMPQLRRLSPAVPLGLLRAAWAFRQLVRRERVDVVVANTSRAAYIAAVALIGTGVPLIWWVRDFLFGRTAFRLLAGRADRFICVSAAIRDYYGGRHDPRFSVIHVGSSLDEELPDIDPGAVAAERARWGFDSEDVVVGFMGRLVDDKGPEDVVEAVAIANATDPRIKLLSVGSGRGQVGDVEEELQRRVAARGLDFVVFAGFQRAQALYYRVFDLFVLSTRTPEPYATSVVQAMMAEVPVVATATGGTPELVRDGDTGLLVPPCSPREMANAILRLATDAGLRARVIDAARDEVLAHNRERVTTALAEQVYDSLLGRLPASRG